ncbi:MAG TPA: membrane protein insertion efficiency factor YidD [Vicinamibacterales bacterium]
MPTFARLNPNSAMRCDGPADHQELAGDESRPIEEMPVVIERPGLPGRALLAAVRGYQLPLSPLFAGSCRYTPSCSRYMSEAIRRHGAIRGGWLGLRRLARCHPLGSSGFDPVPDPCAPHSRSDYSPGKAR